MISLEDRQCLARDIEAAQRSGARLALACGVAGIDLRTLQRWKAQRGSAGLSAGDGHAILTARHTLYRKAREINPA